MTQVIKESLRYDKIHEREVSFERKKERKKDSKLVVSEQMTFLDILILLESGLLTVSMDKCRSRKEEKGEIYNQDNSPNYCVTASAKLRR